MITLRQAFDAVLKGRSLEAAEAESVFSEILTFIREWSLSFSINAALNPARDKIRLTKALGLA